MTEVPAPPTLAELKAIRDPAQQAMAAKAYIVQREDAIQKARSIRDAAIRRYSKGHSLTETAAACGVSVATVKVVNRTA